ncbi:hypothetical protein [Nocardia tengchongensis]|uniref:hypothetical protein n=1 Tax=Nocardia tengchongensis TaxID=2055889 RepID=UPI003646E8B8
MRGRQRDNRNRETAGSVARRVIVVGAIPLALAVACSSTGDTKIADGTAPQVGVPLTGSSTSPGDFGPQRAGTPGLDTQSGTTNLNSQDIEATGPGGHHPGPRTASAQPGVALPAGDSDRPVRTATVQPGVTVPNRPVPQPMSPQPQSQLADYPVPANFRPIPNTRDAAPALDVQTLHAPTPVTPVLPIAPPPRTVRIGDFTTPAPDDLPDNILDGVNGLAADTEAGLATGLNSIGVNPSRSDKIAAGTLAGAAAGAGIGAVGAGVPAALAGAAVGGTAGAAIGTAVGFGLGSASAVVTPGLAAIDVPGGMIGGALIGGGVGAAAGAAAAGLPAAALGGMVGGAAGATVGGFLGGAL